MVWVGCAPPDSLTETGRGSSEPPQDRNLPPLAKEVPREHLKSGTRSLPPFGCVLFHTSRQRRLALRNWHWRSRRTPGPMRQQSDNLETRTPDHALERSVRRRRYSALPPIVNSTLTLRGTPHVPEARSWQLSLWSRSVR